MRSAGDKSDVGKGAVEWGGGSASGERWRRVDDDGERTSSDVKAPERRRQRVTVTVARRRRAAHGRTVRFMKQ